MGGVSLGKTERVAKCPEITSLKNVEKKGVFQGSQKKKKSHEMKNGGYAKLRKRQNFEKKRTTGKKKKIKKL